MPIFEYKAADSDGKLKSGQMEALDRDSVIDYLKDQHLLVVSVKTKASPVLGLSLSGKVTTLDKITFTGNLAIMLKASVNMTEALDVIGRETKNVHFKRILADIIFGIENGRSLSESLKNYKKDFNEVFIALIKAGEASGRLEEVLVEINKQLKKEYSLTNKVKSAFAYPVVLVVGLIGVVILLMTFVLPRLVTIFQSSNLKLPFTTKIIFSLTKIFAMNPIITMVSFLALGIIIVFLLRLGSVRKMLSQVVYKIPVASTLLKQIELVRFTRTLGNLLKSGIPILESLEITSKSLTIARFRKDTLEARDDISKGVSLTNAFKKNEAIFSSLLVSVVQVGEKTGQLDSLLFSLADFYEEQVDNALNALANLIEPILLVIVGLAIGGMALSIILPIYQLIGSI